MIRSDKLITLNNYQIDLSLIIQVELARRSTLGYKNINMMLHKKRTNPKSLATLIGDIKKHYPNAITEIPKKVA